MVRVRIRVRVKVRVRVGVGVRVGVRVRVRAKVRGSPLALRHDRLAVAALVGRTIRGAGSPPLLHSELAPLGRREASAQQLLPSEPRCLVRVRVRVRFRVRFRVRVRVSVGLQVEHAGCALSGWMPAPQALSPSTNVVSST